MRLCCFYRLFKTDLNCCLWLSSLSVWPLLLGGAIPGGGSASELEVVWVTTWEKKTQKTTQLCLLLLYHLTGRYSLHKLYYPPQSLLKAQLPWHCYAALSLICSPVGRQGFILTFGKVQRARAGFGPQTPSSLGFIVMGANHSTKRRRGGRTVNYHISNLFSQARPSHRLPHLRNPWTHLYPVQVVK